MTTLMIFLIIIIILFILILASRRPCLCCSSIIAISSCSSSSSSSMMLSRLPRCSSTRSNSSTTNNSTCNSQSIFIKRFMMNRPHTGRHIHKMQIGTFIKRFPFYNLQFRMRTKNDTGQTKAIPKCPNLDNHNRVWNGKGGELFTVSK